MVTPPLNDSVRTLLQRKADDYPGGLKALSLKIRKNGTYLQQFLTKGSPRKLAEDDRRTLAMLLNVSEMDLGGKAPATTQGLSVETGTLQRALSAALTRLVRDTVPLPEWPEILAAAVQDVLRSPQTPLPKPDVPAPKARAGNPASPRPSLAKIERKTR